MPNLEQIGNVDRRMVFGRKVVVSTKNALNSVSFAHFHSIMERNEHYVLLLFES